MHQTRDGKHGRIPKKIINGQRGGTYEGPKAKKTKSISTRLPSDIMDAMLKECEENNCTKSVLLLSILTERYK